ncbi:MAG TPA: site-specific DNA-methyltransferase, partial [Pyrinomonadaceae bacterium]|nr:site-specific DNA-methyltransferase [Pyrinomonadaceae bacterium]
MPTQVPLLSYTRSAELQTPEQIEFDLDSYRDKNYLTHNFHPYPAKFVPQIPRRIIEALSRKDEIVIDPFCGSGTTLVEANLLGRHGIGFDSNALAVLISRVKTTALSADSLRKIAQFLSDVGNQVQVVKGKLRIPSSSIPEFRNKDHWFESHIQNELAFIKKLIFDVPDARVRDFLKVAFSAIIVKASNQDSDTRWVAVKKNLPEGFAIEAFLSKARDMLSRMAEFSKVELG